MLTVLRGNAEFTNEGHSRSGARCQGKHKIPPREQAVLGRSVAVREMYRERVARRGTLHRWSD